MTYAPGGITYSFTGVATVPEIVAVFDDLKSTEILRDNWMGAERWQVTDETYINGVMLAMDFDYMMGYLIEAVDRTSGQCTYVAIVQYHGRKADGTFQHDFMSWPGTHTFFGKDDGFDRAEVCKWGVDAIHGFIEAHNNRGE
jgi:hypothetical protein